MDFEIKSGKYVVAVSGGVDSMALLHALVQKKVDIVVAHLDHGIRSDSQKDRELVEKTAEHYGVPFEYKEVSLGEGASEATARDVRYKFLREVKDRHSADAIITAHHQDDLLETAILNMLRGTGRKGLTSLSNSEDLVRPLLKVKKTEIINYANQNNLSWNEDSTNKDTNYLRNYVRLNLLPTFSNEQKEQFLKSINNLQGINEELDEMLSEDILSHGGSKSLERAWFISLPYDLTCEVTASWLRQNGIKDFDRSFIQKLVVGVKVSEIGKQLDVRKNFIIKINQKDIELASK